MAGDLPSSVLFACTQNVIRSVMAAAIMKQFYGHKVYVASCGLKPGTPDPFVTAVMDEIGIDLGKHRPQGFEDLEDSSFDLVISLSPEAHHRALEMTRTMAIDAEYWPTMDPSITAGSREQILDSYRDVRDNLVRKIRQRFGSVAARGV
ncbi:low molecular weight phosphatase family protein [Aestuariivirga sp.]|uniref:arsenate-mycothiol transferase ArsC n=1 Tax=Aestuariivirga sp. TaxID=2650926 RepID=UPI003593A884